MSGTRDETAVWEVVTEWLTAAEIDRRTVIILVTVGAPLLGVAAYHCQQTAEKILKGFLVLAGRRFRKTHVLEDLGDSVKEEFPAVSSLVEAVTGWTLWNFAFRYPTEGVDAPIPSPDELKAALEILDQLSSALRQTAPKPIN